MLTTMSACMQDMAGSLQSLCWGSAAVGGVLSAYFSGSLVDAWGPRGVFAATATFPLIVSVAALLIAEKPTQPLVLDGAAAVPCLPLSIVHLHSVFPGSGNHCSICVEVGFEGVWDRGASVFKLPAALQSPAGLLLQPRALADQ